MKYKISVIVPIFNSARYIEKCVESLMLQTLDEIEFIFINDASTDDSLDILRKVTNKFPNRYTKIINFEKNSGISNARNIGLANATGEYVTHCDSDDWVEPEMYATLYQMASEYSADIAACNFKHEYENSTIEYYQNYSSDMKENMRRLLNGEIFPSLWTSIIKRELIIRHNICFPDNLNMGEDLLFNVKAYYYANKITHSDSFFYHYRHSGNSICVRRSRKSIDSDIAIAGLIEKFLIKYHCQQEYEQEILYRKFFSKLALINTFEHKTDYKEWLQIFPETHTAIMSYKRIEPKLRFMLWLSAKGMFKLAQIIKHLIEWQHTIRTQLPISGRKSDKTRICFEHHEICNDTQSEDN